jgi:hypothetical protein
MLGVCIELFWYAGGMYRIIFEHHPKKGQESQFIAQWQAGSDVIQTYPGALGTNLFNLQ